MRHTIQKAFIILLLFTCTGIYAQKRQGVMYGLGGLYDIQDKGIAIDARASIPVLKKLYISPRISFFPSFNNVNELYAGTDIDYHLFRNSRLSPYIYAGGYFDDWFNSSEFHNKKAKKSSLVPECGAGLMFNIKCFHPYIEYRYDAYWQEGSLGAGLMFQFGGCLGSGSGSAGSNVGSKRSEKHCPHF